MKKYCFTFLILLGASLFAPVAIAQNDSQIKLTITPPMIRNNVNPGQIWRSSIKLVNNNSSAIDVYVNLRDFKGGKDDGTVEFLPPLEETEETGEVFLSKWIEITKDPINIPAYKSVDIPFSIRVPESAEPGGHYAAILAGTQPDDREMQGSAMKVSSLLASLILLNVQGDVEERGQIREFSTSHKYYGNEEVDFTVRFQNSGNVHIQPQGEIRIYNMWGKDKGAIAINQGSAFGNVLPGDIRKWNFAWQPENNLLEMGRYKAVLILGYGNQARQTVDRTMYFWIIFMKPLMIAVGSIILFVTLITLSIKFYIRRAIIRTQREAGIIPPVDQSTGKRVKVMPNSSTVVDLKSTMQVPAQRDTKEVKKERVRWAFFRDYSRAIIIVILIMIGGISYVYYQRNYGQTPTPENTELVERPQTEEAVKETQNIPSAIIDEATSTDSEKENVVQATSTDEITNTKTEEPTIDNSAFTLRIANGSGYIGAASDIDKVLYASGYKADKLGNADNFNYQITLIKYLEDFEKEAQDIGRIIKTQVEMQKVEKQDEDILVIVGKNIK